ncbi:hypothetical protein PI126_g16117 [Phytophthora idaei]|nr:hypothetical protein PI126_g16117 [Phytophthora idaei]
MPRTKITWALLAKGQSAYDSDMLLESLYVVKKSELSPCSLCTEPTPHNMRTRLLHCKCKACKAVAPYASCPWKGKTQTCILSNVASISEPGQHVSPLRPPHRPRLTEEMKAFVRDMCTYNRKPMNIYNGIVRRFQARPDLLRRVREMQKAGSIREVSPLKNSIGFLTGSASLLTASNVVHVVSDQLLRVYDPQDQCTKEALPITACLSTQKARMETEVIPGSGW